MRRHELTLRFVEFIPDAIEEHTLYVSMNFATAVHRCCCGCGREVVTPLTPTDWQLTFDGVHISLHPSIGNWSFECQSHYWIRNNRVQWAPAWSKTQIEGGRAHDELRKDGYYGRSELKSESAPKETTTQTPGFWSRVQTFLSRWLGFSGWVD